jgi:hypothetical protein
MAQPRSISFAQIIDWVEGRLDAEQSAAVARQVEVDATLAADVAWLRRFLQVSQSVTLAEPPADLRMQLRARFAAHKRSQPGLLQRLIAALSFDSGPQPLLTGVRSAARSPRQWVFTTQIADIALVLQPRGDDRFDLLGQILPLNAPSAPAPVGEEAPIYRVHLLTGSDTETEEVAITESDDLGEFVFPDLAPGGYQLLLHAEDRQIFIPHFDLTLHV